MNCTFETAISGLAAYIDKAIFPTFNKTQSFVGHFVIGRYVSNINILKSVIVENEFLKPLAIFNDDGHVEVDSIMTDLKNTMMQVGNLEINIPYVGPYSFGPADVDILFNCIKEKTNENY